MQKARKHQGNKKINKDLENRRYMLINLKEYHIRGSEVFPFKVCSEYPFKDLELFKEEILRTMKKRSG